MAWLYSVSVAAGVWGWDKTVFVLPVLLAVIPFLNPPQKRRILFIASLLAACFFYGQFALRDFERKTGKLKTYITGKTHGQKVLTGWVCGFPEQRLSGVRFLFETTLGDETIRLLVSGVNFNVGYGDSLSLGGKVSTGGKSRLAYLQSRGAHGYFRAPAGNISLLKRHAAGFTAKKIAWQIHRSVRLCLARNLGAGSGLPVALSLGEKGWISRRVKTAFPRLGIFHLFALSGMHLGLIAGFVLVIGRMLGFRNGLVLLIILTVYVCVVGEVISLFRAYVMSAALILAAAAERPLKPLNALGKASLVLLLARPALAFSVAFQLSLTATLAVLLCITRLRFPGGTGWPARILSTAYSTVLVGCCVQGFLLPVQIHYFGGVSVVTPLATVLFLPLVSAVMCLSGAALVTVYLADPITPYMFSGLDVCSRWLERLLMTAGAWAPGSIQLPQPDFWIYYTGQALWWVPAGRGRGARVWKVFTIVRIIGGLVLCILAFDR